MVWFLIGIGLFFTINFGLALAFRRWGVTPYSYTEQWDPKSRSGRD